jgi:hypothetical protein
MNSWYRKIAAPKATTRSCPLKWLATVGMPAGRMPWKLGWRVGNGHREGLGATHTGSDSFSASRTAPSHPAGVSMPARTPLPPLSRPRR